MSIDYLAVIADQSRRMADILRAGPLDARVPGTPDWNLGELGVHLVGVQQWATAVVRSGAAPEVDAPLPEPANAADALLRSSGDLVEVLGAADPVAPCWNFSSAPDVAGFWFRRQAIEVSLHRWDAASAVSDTPDPLDPTLAADAIDEFVTIMLQRVIDREGLDVAAITGDVHLHCTDPDAIGAAGEWTFELIDGAVAVTAEHRKAAVAIRGEASDLALFLYNRIPADSVEVFGDQAALAQWSRVFEF